MSAPLSFFVDFPGIIFCGVELLMVLFFWFVNYYVDNNDFTKAYVTVLMVPLSGSTITKLWSVVNSVAGVPPIGTTYGDISFFIGNLYGSLIMTSQLYILMGSIGFALLLVMSLLQPHRCDEKQDLWFVFLLIKIS
ncbi:hypothetical protein ANCCAN_07675 [Ancylostoma caninum]|uniref:Uncharacterized protein n=1 Tax=Ancylostoma caninum TaxID=29170 RepID=A0A368GTG8_ANCCA|nr:hypothetical protein ANCCAN_07675 [Ancylostoma caninum]